MLTSENSLSRHLGEYKQSCGGAPSLRYNPPIHNVYESRPLSLRILHVSQRYYGPVIGDPSQESGVVLEREIPGGGALCLGAPVS